MFAFRRVLTSIARGGKNLSRIQQKHTLPKLPYEYSSLEPVICAEIMQLHYLKHHQAYVNGLNETEEKMKEVLQKGDFATAISLGNALRFHGGGHINHSIFWENMHPDNQQPTDEFMKHICRDFESLDNLMEEMSKMAVAIQGSGWAWLAYNPQNKRLQLATCANQDPLQPTTGMIPLLGIDVWEHAYYLQYKSARNEYVKKFWDVVNWQNVSERCQNAMGGSNGKC